MEPRTAIEVGVAGIWADVLGVPAVGLDDDFLDLGGSSLLAVRVMRRLNRHFGVELPVRALFEAPTAAGLARSVTRTRKEAPAFPLSPGQRDAWVGEQRHPGLYPGTPALRLRGPLDVAALEWSLGEICARHEALRTTFDTRDGEPVQIVGPPRGSRLTPVDLRELPHPVRDEAAARLLDREARRPFELTRDPMLRATLLRLDDEEHLLLLVIHHIACDAWSLDVLLNELAMLYGQIRSGQRANLPELPVQYADYAIWQRERLWDGTLRASVDYWKKKLAPSAGTGPFPGPPSSAGANVRSRLGGAEDARLAARGATRAGSPA